jgi:hypothetical protein
MINWTGCEKKRWQATLRYDYNIKVEELRKNTKLLNRGYLSPDRAPFFGTSRTRSNVWRNRFNLTT